MNGEIIKSYLVSLSADTDMASFTKFDGVLKSTGKTVANSIGGIVGDFLKFQIGATAAFEAVGFSVIGYIDHLAMADQRTKMLAMQNGMSVGSYRAMTNALDVMGVSLTDVFHGTKQMQEQFADLVAHQQKLNTMIGPDYENQMDQVMRVHTQFQKLELDVQAFGMKFASDLLTKSGFGNDGLLAQLERLNDWILEKMPEWSEELSTDIIPVMKDFWGIVKESGQVLWGLAGIFTNVMGALEGDKSLESSTINFHLFVKAVGYAVDEVATLLREMLAGEKVALDFGAAVSDAFHGDGKGIKRHLKDAWDATSDKNLTGQGDFSTPTSTLSSFLDGKGQQQAIAEAQRVSKDTGIPANLILGQWEHETGNFTNRGATQLNNFAGIRYPGSKEYRNFNTVDDFGNYYASLLKSKRYANNGVLAARTPEQFAHSLKAGGYYEDTEKNYAAGIARFSQPNISVNVNVGTVSNTTVDQVRKAVKQGASDAYQQHMAQLNGAYGG